MPQITPSEKEACEQSIAEAKERINELLAKD
jgi:hypothetical protein